MTTFLSSIVRDLLSEHEDLSGFTFILPGKRAGAFLRNEISKQIVKPVFSPEILSIEEFSEKISGLTTLDNVSALFEFYRVYTNATPADRVEDFESFSNWAQTLLNDFNEIDRFLISPNDIFNYLSEIQDINHWSLSVPQTDLVKNYLEFWKRLPIYYNHLRENLLKEKSGYQGLVYRVASERISLYSHNAINHIFLGFNALNTAEQVIVQEMISQGAQIIWDIDEAHFNDPHHDASLFIREHAKWPYYKTNKFKKLSSDFNTLKNIEIAGIPKNIGQAKYVAEILAKMTQEQLSSTAVVLGDESLLVPILNSLPENVPALNITMGYPLKYSPFSTLFDTFFQMMKTGSSEFYFKEVITILSNPVIQKITHNKSMDIVREIKDKNLLYLKAESIKELFNDIRNQSPLLFFPENPHSPLQIVTTLKKIILEIRSWLSPFTDQLLLEFLFQFNTIVEELDRLMKKYPHIKTVNSLYNFYKEISGNQSLDFQGKPFQGLQLMGMLESRVLDFETVILTSVNEGTLPAGKSNNSFIPYELKKTYKLPTHKEKDAVYTYHFYHVIQRAKNVYLLHNMDNDSEMGGEKSRFLIQLELEKQPNHIITNRIIAPEVPPIRNDLQEIQKTSEIMGKLRELCEKGLSPSALTTYIRNPLDFYKQYILGIREAGEVEETVAYNTLGTVVHDTLENFYSPLQGQLLTEEILHKLQAKITEEVKLQFEKTYSKVPLTRGKNLLIFEVAKRYVSNMLKMELKELHSGRETEILKIETNLTSELEIEGLDHPVKIKGKVDRVDRTNGIFRIIDYKTGKVEQKQLEIVDWNDLTTDYDKYGKPFQVLMYAKMLLDNTPVQGPVEAGIISFKNLKPGFLKFGKKTIPRDKHPNYLIDTTTMDEFLIQLKSLIREICDPKVPFKEKEIKNYGNY
jgi:ATP-dependent helicase/nuclease subunit B